ncbi:protein DOWNY MILDEW RESISTANCE 6-like, partial [Herrania umbratica]|uniref:Protein DOWNY MILDEW RESISTANCE 6-like n=1 Tax=Herrania umbratica TaxID=108875 RepID=A0A6J1AGX7_9ROSI
MQKKRKKKKMSEALQLPIVDLSSPDCISTANSIRQACMDHGFFYLVNHGVEEELLKEVFEQSSKFFSLPVEEKMKLAENNRRGYTALYAGKLDTSLNTKGDSKESFCFGPLADHLNRWPLEENLPSWRSIMETYHKKVLCAGT